MDGYRSMNKWHQWLVTHECKCVSREACARHYSFFRPSRESWLNCEHFIKDLYGNWRKKMLTCSSCLHCSTPFLPLLLIFQGLVHNLDHWDTEGLKISHKGGKHLILVMALRYVRQITDWIRLWNIFFGKLYFETLKSKNAVQPCKPFVLTRQWKQSTRIKSDCTTIERQLKYADQIVNF